MERILTKGRLVYDPVRHDFKKAHKTRTLIIQLARDDLDLYYQWFITRHGGQNLQLQRPMYGTHVTLVGGAEFVPRLDRWKKHEGKIIEFEYDPVVRNHQMFWSLPVYGDHLQEYRLELGMKPEPDFHITVGRQYDWQPIPRSARRRASEIRRERALAEGEAA